MNSLRGAHERMHYTAYGVVRAPVSVFAHEVEAYAKNRYGAGGDFPCTYGDPMSKFVDDLRREYERACVAYAEYMIDATASPDDPDYCDEYRAVVRTKRALQQRQRDQQDEEAIHAITTAYPVTAHIGSASATAILSALRIAGFEVRKVSKP